MTPPRLAYLYCVGRAGAASAIPGLPGLEADLPPYAIETHGLAGIASDVPSEDYGEAPLATHLSDLAWVGEKGIAHERVVEAAFGVAPTIPLRFGTIYESRSRVEAFLDRHADRLHQILDELAGKAEWGICVYLDRARFESHLRSAVGSCSPETGRAGGGPGRSYLEAKRAARMARLDAAQELDRTLEEIHAAHAALAAAAVRHPPGEEGTLVSKCAYLVAAQRREEFKSASEAEIARRRNEGLLLRRTGPWPPYAFVPPLKEPRP